MEFRTALPEEVRQIVDLANYVFRTSKNLEPSMGRQFPMLLSPENASNLYVAVDDGKVVAHIGIKKNNAFIFGHRVSMAGMGSVCTHPDYRGQGLATKLLHIVFENLEKQGVALLKISGNRGLYKNNGCIEIESISSHTFDGESCFDNARGGEGYKYDYLDESQAASILAHIYQREPVRYERSKWQFPVLFHAMPTVHPPAGRKHTAVVAYRSSAADNGLAYVIGFEKTPGVYEIIEYAGERSAIPGMIEYLIKQKGMKEVKFNYPSYDAVLTELFGSIAPSKEEINLSPMTVKIINKQVLWSEIFPIIQERWPDRNCPESLEDLQKIADQHGEPLIKFLFADYQRPCYGSPWNEVLPIELPWFNGLSYV